MTRAHDTLAASKREIDQDREGDRKWVLSVLLGSRGGLTLRKLHEKCVHDMETWTVDLVHRLCLELAASNRVHRDGDRWFHGAGAKPYVEPSPAVKFSPPRPQPLPDVRRPEPLPPRSGVSLARTPPIAPRLATRALVDDEAALYPSQSAHLAPQEEDVEVDGSQDRAGGPSEHHRGREEEGDPAAPGPSVDSGGVPGPETEEAPVEPASTSEPGPTPTAEAPGAWVVRRMTELGLSPAQLSREALPGESKARQRDRGSLQSRISSWRRRPQEAFGNWQRVLESVLGPYGSTQEGPALVPPSAPGVPGEPPPSLSPSSEEPSSGGGADDGRAVVTAGEAEQPAGATAGGEALTSASSSSSGPSGDRQPESEGALPSPVSSPCPPLRVPALEPSALAPEPAPEVGEDPEGAGSGDSRGPGLRVLASSIRVAHDLLGDVRRSVGQIEQLAAEAESREARIALLERQNAELWERVTEAETALERMQEQRAALRQLLEGP